VKSINTVRSVLYSTIMDKSSEAKSSIHTARPCSQNTLYTYIQHNSGHT